MRHTFEVNQLASSKCSLHYQFVTTRKNQIFIENEERNVHVYSKFNSRYSPGNLQSYTHNKVKSLPIRQSFQDLSQKFEYIIQIHNFWIHQIVIGKGRDGSKYVSWKIFSFSYFYPQTSKRGFAYLLLLRAGSSTLIISFQSTVFTYHLSDRCACVLLLHWFTVQLRTSSFLFPFPFLFLHTLFCLICLCFVNYCCFFYSPFNITAPFIEPTVVLTQLCVKANNTSKNTSLCKQR